MTRIAAFAAIAAISLLSGRAYAESALDEVRVGVFGQSWGGPGSDKEQTPSVNLEALFHSPRFLSVIGAPRPHLGATIAADLDATHQFYGGLEWDFSLGGRFFAAVSTGIAVHTGETKFDPIADAARANDTVFLGCRVLLRGGADLGYKLTERASLSLHINHISNAGMCAPNEGLDNAGIRLGYRFSYWPICRSIKSIDVRSISVRVAVLESP